MIALRWKYKGIPTNTPGRENSLIRLQPISTSESFDRGTLTS
jgi:hypothetical protein